MRFSTFGQFIKEISGQYKDKTALIWRPKFRALKFTYKELYRLASIVAHYLEKEKIAPGERIILWASNSPWWVGIFFGCQLKGVTVVPLAAQNTPEFVKKIAEFTKAKLIFKNQRLPILAESVKTVIVEDFFDNWQEKPTSYEETEVSGNDIAEILFTSGTTGEPKGTELRHSNILSNIEAVSSLSVGLISPKDRILTFLPLSHIFSQAGGLFIPLSFGLSITLAAQVSGLHIRMNMQEDQPTIMTAVPEFLKLVLKRIEEKAKEQGQLKKLQLLYTLAPRLPMMFRRILAKKILNQFGGKLVAIVSGGAALDPEVGRKWESFGIYVIQGYGATETSPIVSVNRFKGRKIESVGPPIPGVEVKIAPDGEILVRGPNVVKGYFKNQGKTNQAFKDGWYYTDDLGFIDKDGHLHILGRKKYLIVTPAGENVYPEDLETKLNQEPEVADSAAVGLREENRFEIHAVLLPKFGATLNPEALIRRVNQKLEPYQRIQGASVWPEEDFPRTPTKKVKKEIVLQWLKQKGKEKPKIIKEVGPIEKILAEITNLSPKEITPEKRLVLDLKMDSLARLTFVAAVEEDLNIILDEAEIKETTTVGKIKEKILRKEQKEERYPLKEWPLTPFILGLRAWLQKLLIWPIIAISSKRMEIRGIKELSTTLEFPAIFFFNHISFMDAAFFLAALPSPWRRKTAIAAATDIVFEDPVVKKFAKPLVLFFNVYPFSRFGQIKSSLEYTGRLLDRGFSIFFFPEGRISPTGQLENLKEGAGLIAVEMGVPIIPAAISGTNIIIPYGSGKFLWWKRPRVKIVFGKPLRFTPKDSVSQVTKKIEEEMRKIAL